jgi:hypothetical protein
VQKESGGADDCDSNDRCVGNGGLLTRDSGEDTGCDPFEGQSMAPGWFICGVPDCGDADSDGVFPLSVMVAV